MKVRGAIKLIEADGWYLIVIKGSTGSTSILQNWVE
jgi:predicted RNA binding protein YcfA (HicA-like mRNA interferase family)